MRSSATARRSSINHADDVVQTQAQIDHWLFDCEQLARWQSDLMTYCRAINRQLTQIHSGLNAVPLPGSEDNNAVSLRIVADHDRVWP
jgi:hypothetical protein